MIAVRPRFPAVIAAAVCASVLTGCTTETGSPVGAATVTSTTVNVPPMAPNQLVELSGTAPWLKPVADPGKALLIGIDRRLQLIATGTPQVVTTDSGERQAAGGQRLLVAQFKVTGGTTGRSSQDDGGAVSLVVDGARLPVKAEDEDVIAVSVPTVARDVALELTTGELKQSVSLLTGERTGEGPTVLYRPDAKTDDDGTAVRVTMSERLTFPFALYDATGNPQLPDGKYPTVVDVQRANLTYVLDRRGGEPLYPSGPDKALLTLDAKVTGGNTWITALDPASFVLELPDGQRVPARRIDDPGLAEGRLQDDDNQFFGGALHWEVPGDLSTATLTITAGKNHMMGGSHSSYVLDYHNASKSLPIRF